MDPATATLIAQLVQQELNRRDSLRAQQPSLQQPSLQQDNNMPLSRSDSCLSSHSTSAFSSASSSASSFSTPVSSSASSGPPRCPARPKKRLREIMFANNEVDDASWSADDEDVDDEFAGINPNELLRQDRKDLLRPILEFFDYPLLAKKDSPLFIFKKKKIPNSDGCFELKKNEELNLRLWGKLIRHRLKQIMGNSYRNSKLVSRFRHAARKIVCKRRANHNQSWRLYGCHKKLIYSQNGKTPICKKKRKLFKRESLSDVPAYKRSRQTDKVIADLDADIVAAPDLDADFESEENFEESQLPTSDDDDAGLHPQPLPDVSTANKPPPPVSKLHHNKTTCVKCGKRLDFNSCFPQDHEDWAPSVSRPIRCGECWDSFIQEEVMPEMNERIEKQNSKIKQNHAGDQQIKKTCKKKKKCKCGSVYHSMTTHSDCPMNPRNLRKQPAATPVGIEESDSQIPAKKRSKKNLQCKCGATTHRTTRHRLCPLNKKNVKSAVTKSAVTNYSSSATSSSVDAVAKKSPSSTTSSVDAVTKSSSSVTSSSVEAIAKKSPSSTTFQVGDCCLAQWRRNQWFLAHVTRVSPSGTDVYFPGDGQTKKNLSEKHLRPCEGCVTPVRRGELIGSEFDYDGDDTVPAGKFKVRRIKGNCYVCVRLTGEGPNNLVDDFDIGYVMKTVRRAREVIRGN